MYIPKQFEVHNTEEAFKFIEANAFGQLISTTKGRPVSTHMPFLLSEDKQHIYGHLAIQNPQQTELEGQEVLVSLEGPHDYISPTWYLGPGVPTWNYQAVHLYGKAKVFTESQKLQWVVNSLTEKYESGLPNPWTPEYNPKMLNAIVGIEIEINEMQAQFKLSQNKSQEERINIIKNLEQHGSAKLSEAMKRNVL